MISQLNAGLRLIGVDMPKIFMSLTSLPQYIRDHRALKKALLNSGSPFKIRRFVPCLCDQTAPSGTATSAYFLQDLLVAGKIFRKQPQKHVDVGSSVAGFVAHVASFREIEVFDIRPLKTQATSIVFHRADFMADSVGHEDYTDSLSCLHAIEHFGLGRYGDRIDPNGHLKGIDNLYRILKPGGTLYISAPIGPQRIEFNAHRVFALEYFLSLFTHRFSVRFCAYVNDKDEFIQDAELTEKSVSDNFGCHHGIVILELLKLA